MNAISRPVVVVIVLPPEYAFCKLMTEPVHCTTWLVLVRQSVVPLPVPRPTRLKNESESVLMVTPFVPDGVNVACPLTVRSLERVVAPVTPRVPPKVVAPVPTVKVLEPVTDVLPLREIAPVPVEKVPVPEIPKLPVD